MEKTITSPGLFRIAIVGPESTGKTTLAEQLAKHYHTLFATEYAREYIDKLGRPYTFDDIVIISKKQIELEDKAAEKANKILICDTNLLVSKIWAEHVYKACPDYILNTIQIHKYSLYLVTAPDIPWEADTQREHPHLREYLFNMYLAEVAKQNTPYQIITGKGKDRLNRAIKIIDKALALNNAGN